MRAMSLFAGALAALLALPALAQQQPAPEGTPLTIRGTIEKLDGATLVVKSREGASMNVALAPNVSVTAPIKKSISDLKEGDLVGSTSVKKADGKYHALEVHFLPPTVQERQFAFDLAPDSTMTNAKVATVINAPEGNVLRVNVDGKPFDVIIDSTTPIVAFGPGDMSLLKPGAFVRVNARRLPNGSITAASLAAEKDGVKPPN
jgi:hypothetical protein